MIEADKRKAMFLLHQEGMSLHEIAIRLGASRNTVRSVIQSRGEMPLSTRRDKIRIDTDLLQRLYGECDGWIQRVHEKLMEEEGVQVKYSTLTRILRNLGLGRPQETRCDRVPDQPGVECHYVLSFIIMLSSAL